MYNNKKQQRNVCSYAIWVWKKTTNKHNNEEAKFRNTLPSRHPQGPKISPADPPSEFALHLKPRSKIPALLSLEILVV